MSDVTLFNSDPYVALEQLTSEPIGERVYVNIPGEPRTKVRARFFNGHAYDPKQNQDSQMVVGMACKTASRWTEPNVESRFGVRLLFRSMTYKSMDIDNMIKLVFDACTGVIWGDDRQVVEVTAKLERGGSVAETLLMFYTVDGGLLREAICLNCKRLFRVFPKSKRKWCSKLCEKDGRRSTAQCQQCGANFTLAACLATRQKYCSRTCSFKAQSKRQQASPHASNKWRCLTCGGLVTRKEYARCRGCSMKLRSVAGNYWKMRRLTA